MAKRALYFMPDNPMRGRAGNTTRLRQLLSYFNDNSDIKLTFVSLRDWGSWQAHDVLTFKETYSNITLKLLEKKHRRNWFTYFFLYKIPYLFRVNDIDISSLILRRNFRKIADSSGFDTIIISYASWGKLIKDIAKGQYLINDTHDFITAQSKNKRNQIGSLFQSEMNILRKFDEIWTYSVEEQYIFEQFTDKKVTLMPVTFPFNFTTENNKKYDVIYVASDNPHNVTGMKWLITSVLPFLEKVKIHVIGKIGAAIPDHPNLVKHGMVEDLDEFYRQAKIAVCPMLTGTGIKIKVLEALSYGLPVVTNRRGVDGLINKTENGCLVTNDAENFAKKMLELLKDEHFYSEIQREAVSYFRKNHDPASEKAILDKTFK